MDLINRETTKVLTEDQQRIFNKIFDANEKRQGKFILDDSLVSIARVTEDINKIDKHPGDLGISLHDLKQTNVHYSNRDMMASRYAQKGKLF